jgi:hypothetical protein
MASIIDTMIQPLLLIPPVLQDPFGIADVICAIVELIRGGAVEDIPGIGEIIEYLRIGVIALILAILLIHKIFQWIGPPWWHFVEGTLKVPENNPGDKPSDCGITGECGPVDWTKFVFFKALYGIELLINGLLTYFLQIPVDFISLDWESLAIDFDSNWTQKSIFRGQCERFINGSYAGDFSLYECKGGSRSDKEVDCDQQFNKYTADVLHPAPGTPPKYVDKPAVDPHAYLCTHGRYCPDMADLFGPTMMNIDEYSGIIPSGNINGINISSAPRKYATCCYGVQVVDCVEHCREDSPIDIDNLRDPKSLITDMSEMARHPINTIDEVLDVFSNLPPEDYNAIKCNFKGSVHDWWHSACTYHEHIKKDSGIWGTIKGGVEDIGDAAVSAVIICPDTVGFHKPGTYGTPPCTKGWSDIGHDIQKAYDERNASCIAKCDSDNNITLNKNGCNSLRMRQAKNSIEKNIITILENQIKEHDQETNSNEDLYIKRTPWTDDDKVSTYDGSRREQIDKINASLTSSPGCGDPFDEDLCFGPFRPLTGEAYPELFNKFVKDLIGDTLYILLYAAIVFIILYILCLLNPVGRGAYEANNNAGMVESIAGD